MFRQTMAVVCVWSLVAGATALCVSSVATGATGQIAAQHLVPQAQQVTASTEAASELEKRLVTVTGIGPCIEPNGLV